MRITAILFDFGGVLTPSPFGALRAWHAARGIDPELGLQTLFGPYDRDTDHPWHQLERGEIPASSAIARIRQAAAAQGFDLDLPSMFRAMGGSAAIRQEVVSKVLALRAAGYRTALVTNNIKEYSSTWRAQIAVDDMFDAVVDSSAVGVRKPDARIYRLALEQLGAQPQESVFLDDAPGNVEGARAVGMRAILVEDDYARALAELDALLAPEAEAADGNTGP